MSTRRISGTVITGAGLVATVTTVASVLFICAQVAFAANGDQYTLTVGQKDPFLGMWSIPLAMRTYRNTSDDTCYTGTWCCKTVTTSIKLSHDHLDTNVNGDLDATQKTRADDFWEWWYPYTYGVADFAGANRQSSASAVTNCHGYALYYPNVWLNDSATAFQDDFTSVALGDLQEDDLCAHQNDHTSFITQLDGTGCGQTVVEVQQKCGTYGVYRSVPNTAKYGGPVGYWREK